MDNKQVTAEWIAQQRKICDAATPGPWEANRHKDYQGEGYGTISYFVSVGNDLIKIGTADTREEFKAFSAIAQFIAAARTALPAALDALEAALVREAEKEKEIKRLIHDYSTSTKRLIDEKDRLTVEAGRISLAEEEKDTMMKRRKEQIEVIRTRIDKGGLCDAEKRLLNDLNLPSNYDRRSCTPRTEGYKDD